MTPLGLAQLVATGDLEHRESFVYLARAIPRFPAGLHGAHLVRFVLATGVPMPDGDPGHSCVFSEETGRPMANDFICTGITVNGG